MLTWAKLVLALVQITTTVLSYARENQLLDAGAEQAINALLTKQLEIINNANKAGNDAATRNASVPSTSSLPNDGYRRD